MRRGIGFFCVSFFSAFNVSNSKCKFHHENFFCANQNFKYFIKSKVDMKPSVWARRKIVWCQKNLYTPVFFSELCLSSKMSAVLL